MTKAELAAKMNDVGAVLPGKTVKLDFGDQGTIMLDGKANAVTEDDGAADTTIKIAWDDWQAMADGQLDGMTAFMTGKLKVEGDMSNAMQLQGVLSKLKG
ncbi:MAG: SCP2 sterol-binding domain-containing protein [Pseudomonadota bacterium]